MSSFCKKHLSNLLPYFFIFSILLFFALQPTSAQSYAGFSKLKMIEKLAIFIDWPPKKLNKSETFVVGFIGDEILLSSFLELIGNSRIKNKKVVAIQIKNAKQVKNAHILYIADERKITTLDAILREAQKNSVLTITENENLLLKGAVLSFYKTTKKIPFKINLDTARISNLSISHLLLQEALIVEN